MNPNVKSKRHAMLGALFLAAQARGISQEQLRDEIAYGVIGKRLSAASEREIGLVLSHVAGPPKRRLPTAKYPSSLQGLRDEVRDLAMVRWGIEWDHSLTALCRKFGVDHFRFLDIAHGKEIKKWLLRKNDG